MYARMTRLPNHPLAPIVNPESTFQVDGALANGGGYGGLGDSEFAPMSPAAAAAAAASALQAQASRERGLEHEYEREHSDIGAPAYDRQPPPPPPDLNAAHPPPPAFHGMQGEPSPKRARHSPSPSPSGGLFGNGLVPPPAPAADGSPGDNGAGGGGVGKVDTPAFMNGGHAAAGGMTGGMSEGPPRGTFEGKEGAGGLIRRGGSGRLSVPSKGLDNGAPHGTMRSTAAEIWQAQK